jgi:hypothetical protein
MLIRGYAEGLRPKPIAVDDDGQLRVVGGVHEPLGYQQLTSLASAAALTVPSGARWAWLQAEAADVRWRDDGSNPTASVGMLLKNGAGLIYDGSLNALRLIEVSASATINVAYYG